MDVTLRFVEVLARPEAEVPLDEAAGLIAAHAYPGLDIDGLLGCLDELASRVDEPTLDGVRRLLFGVLGFGGNVEDYYDPRNSFLNDVLERRTGIPISLAVVTLAVARRVGVPLAGVGMPGHFLLRDRVDPEVFVDPFAGGIVLDRAACRRAFEALHGAGAPFDDAYLEPIGAHAIIGRMLANLRSVFNARGDRGSLLWALRLRTLVPGVPAEERSELARVLTALGRFGEAADELERLSAAIGGDLGLAYQGSAERLRARMN